MFLMSSNASMCGDLCSSCSSATSGSSAKGTGSETDGAGGWRWCWHLFWTIAGLRLNSTASAFASGSASSSSPTSSASTKCFARGNLLLLFLLLLRRECLKLVISKAFYFTSFWLINLRNLVSNQDSFFLSSLISAHFLFIAVRGLTNVLMSLNSCASSLSSPSSNDAARSTFVTALFFFVFFSLLLPDFSQTLWKLHPQAAHNSG